MSKGSYEETLGLLDREIAASMARIAAEQVRLDEFRIARRRFAKEFGPGRAARAAKARAKEALKKRRRKGEVS